MKFRLPFISHASNALGSFSKKHYGAMLFALFLSSIALWGYLFWQYGYQAALYEPKAEVKPLPIKQKELREILDDLDVRVAVQDSVMGKTFPNPFVKPPDASKQ